jgi:hypothetical protein
LLVGTFFTFPCTPTASPTKNIIPLHRHFYKFSLNKQLCQSKHIYFLLQMNSWTCMKNEKLTNMWCKEKRRDKFKSKPRNVHCAYTWHLIEHCNKVNAQDAPTNFALILTIMSILEAPYFLKTILTNTNENIIIFLFTP